jgi:transcriptional regulator of acetoin/glycerol metabolism
MIQQQNRNSSLAYIYDRLRDLPTWFQRLTPGQIQQIAALLEGWRKTEHDEPKVLPLAEMEKREFMRALVTFNGDICAAAKALGISKTTAYRRLKEWGFNGSDWHIIYQASVLADPRL